MEKIICYMIPAMVPSVLENNRWFKRYGTLNNSDIHVGT